MVENRLERLSDILTAYAWGTTEELEENVTICQHYGLNVTQYLAVGLFHSKVPAFLETLLLVDATIRTLGSISKPAVAWMDTKYLNFHSTQAPGIIGFLRDMRQVFNKFYDVRESYSPAPTSDPIEPKGYFSHLLNM